MQQDLEREGLKNTDGEIGLEQEGILHPSN